MVTLAKKCKTIRPTPTKVYVIAYFPKFDQNYFFYFAVYYLKNIEF